MTEKTVDKEELREAVKEGVQDAFIAMGIDHEAPREMQADFQYLRKLRVGRDALTSKVFMGIVGATLTAFVALVTIGFNTLFGSGNAPGN